MMPSASVWTVLICSCGKFGAAFASAASIFCCIDGVGARLLAHRERHRVLAVQAGRRRPILVTVDDLADVLDAHRRAARAQDDVLDFRGGSLALVRSETALPSRLTCPPGTSRLSAASFAATSVIGRFSASRRRGSRLTCSSRTWPPFTSTAATPSICPSSGFRSSSTMRRCDRRQARRADRVGRDRQRRHVEALIVGSLICSGRRRESPRPFRALPPWPLADRFPAAARCRRARSPRSTSR